MNIFKLSLAALLLTTTLVSCGDDDTSSASNDSSDNQDSNTTDIRFTTYKGLVMTGYQGWFNTSGDGMGLDWTHYQLSGKFEPGCSSIDFWPEMDEYEKKYLTPFVYEDGSGAYVFSSADYSTTDLHFKWMQEYGIDGIFLQRIMESLATETKKADRAQITRNVMKASIKYDRVWCLMYAIAGLTSEEIWDMVTDLCEVESLYKISDLNSNPNYLYHNGKPLLAIYGAGFSVKEEGGGFLSADLIELLEESGILDKYSIMLGVPYYWETLENDTTTDPELHELIKRCDIVLPWAVGRYSHKNYDSEETDKIASNVAWCKNNDTDYAQLIFPGFSWGNLQSDYSLYDAFPRNSGDFMWTQIWGAYTQGVEMYYMAMFDEVDEGTAIFKCKTKGNLPLNGDGEFVGYDTDIKSDHYMWLAGHAKKLLENSAGYGENQPIRE